MANVLAEVYSELAFFKPRLILRPQEISNSPEVIRRLGVIAINTALEADVFGNVNSTHVLGDSIVNGLGGSGDFARNASLSIFTTPSTAKNGCISRIVPLVSHVDHTEHCVNVIVTEHGVADLRGKSPRERASAIIERCAHPDYKPLLREYLKLSNKGQTPQSLCSAFSFHQKFIDCGDMRK
jgi:acyl-CoA hydrolase